MQRETLTQKARWGTIEKDTNGDLTCPCTPVHTHDQDKEWSRQFLTGLRNLQPRNAVHFSELLRRAGLSLLPPSLTLRAAFLLSKAPPPSPPPAMQLAASVQLFFFKHDLLQSPGQLPTFTACQTFLARFLSKSNKIYQTKSPA